MPRLFVLIALALFPFVNQAQTHCTTDTLGTTSKTDNIVNRGLFGDSLTSSFCIIIKKEVKAHKHQFHSEHVVVVDGEGLMKLGDKMFTVKKGDVVFIPKNTVHSVKTTSAIPLKVISVQAPRFDGSDRVWVEEK